MPRADARCQRDKNARSIVSRIRTDARNAASLTVQHIASPRHANPPASSRTVRITHCQESFMPMNAEISQDVLNRLLSESIGSPDLSDDKLVDLSSNLLSLSCVYTSCHNCRE
jgi:hypothetical protein